MPVCSQPQPATPGCCLAKLPKQFLFCTTLYRGALEMQTKGLAHCTGRMERIAHRKWKESKQQPSMLSGLAVPGCCLIYFHYLWAIHPIRPVCKAASASDFSQPLQRVLVGFDLPCTPVMTSNNEKSVRRFPSKLSSREESRVICYDGSHDECFGARSALSLRTGGCM